MKLVFKIEFEASELINFTDGANELLLYFQHAGLLRMSINVNVDRLKKIRGV